MKIFEIFGLSRSGHHAMTNWLIKNLCGDECAMNWKLNIMANGLYYINEGNLDEGLTLKYIEENKKNIRVLIISYENCDTNYSILNDNKIYKGLLSLNNENIKNFSENHRIIFVRDYYNNLASRIKSNEKNLSKTREGLVQPWNIDDEFIDQWKDIARNFNRKDFISLKFEDWLDSQSVRDDFMKKIINNGEIYDNKVKGTHSSFNENIGLNSRIQEDEIPQETKELIRKDSELHYLIGKLGYDYKNI
jgi:hypothetical protein